MRYLLLAALLVGCAPAPCAFDASQTRPARQAWSSVVPVADKDGAVGASAVAIHCPDRGPAILLTAEHVMRGGARRLIAGRPVALVRRHPRADLAVVLAYVDDCQAARIPATDPRPGDRVVIVGSADGRPGSVTMGHIVHATLVDSPAGRQWPALRVSAPLIPGQSGGGAFDRAGWLVGIASHYRGPFGLSLPAAGYIVHTRALRKMWGELNRRDQ